ncbi:MAG: hypothetical protein MUF31_15700 [Akkermansiaceae bacterium]|jgi:hypothetical protein|nr:hypothetical protein [Akkermansiaceae bacterium]
MIPRIIHQTWKTQEIPSHLQEYQESWRIHHPDWEYRLWVDEDISRFIRESYPEFSDFYHRLEPTIMKIDFARVAFMHHFGGLYVDLDFEALQPLTPLFDRSQIVVGREQGGIGMHFRGRDFICNALLASPAGHPLWLEVMQEMVRRYRPRRRLEPEAFYVLKLSLEGFDRVLEAYQQANPDIMIASHEMFYPAPPTCRLVQTRRELARHLQSYAIHHFEGSWLGWRAKGINRRRALGQWFLRWMQKESRSWTNRSTP